MSVLHNRKLQAFAICIVLAVSALVVTKMVHGFTPIPLWMRHIYHLAFPPSDLLDPIVVDDLAFWEKGFSKTYALMPKYLDIYALCIEFDSPIPLSFNYDGKIKAEFFQKNRKITEDLIVSSECKYGGGIECYKGVVLKEFEVPFQRKYLKQISVKLTVLEPVKDFVPLKNKMKLFIRVSPRS